MPQSPWARAAIGVVLITIVFAVLLNWLPYAIAGQLS